MRRFATLLLSLIACGLLHAQETSVRADGTIAADATAETETSRLLLVPYAGYSNYNGSGIKDAGSFAGLHAMHGLSDTSSLDLGAEFLKVDYDTGLDVNQWDLTLAYNDFSTKDWQMRAGVHYLTTDDGTIDWALTGILGAHYYQVDNYEVGADVFYTTFPVATPSSFDVVQVSPRFAFVVMQNEMMTLRSVTKLHYIHLSDDPGLNENNFISVEERLSAIMDPVTIAAFIWAGEQVYAVRNEGFSINAQPGEEHQFGFGASAQWDIDGSNFTKLILSREDFSEIGINNDVHVYGVTLLFGRRF